MLIVFIRTIILYILVLAVMRFMGKREIGQLQPFELVISIMIDSIMTTISAIEYIFVSLELFMRIGVNKSVITNSDCARANENFKKIKNQN